MKIYVIEKYTAIGDEIIGDTYYTEIISDAGAFDDYDVAFNTIFSYIKKDIDDAIDGYPEASVSEIDIDDKDVSVTIENAHDDFTEITYSVIELELHRKEG